VSAQIFLIAHRGRQDDGSEKERKKIPSEKDEKRKKKKD